MTEGVRHRLSVVDPENRSAVCARCGPVTIRLKGGGRWRCSRSGAPNHQRRLQPEGVRLLEASDGTCEICGGAPDEGLHVDHSHQTGAIRGLLCRRCNIGLGFVEGQQEWLELALAYLARF